MNFIILQKKLYTYIKLETTFFLQCTFVKNSTSKTSFN